MSIFLIVYCLCKCKSNFNLTHALIISISSVTLVGNVIINSYYFWSYILEHSTDEYYSCQIMTSLNTIQGIYYFEAIMTMSLMRYLYIFHWDQITSWNIKKAAIKLNLLLLITGTSIEALNIYFLGFERGLCQKAPADSIMDKKLLTPARPLIIIGMILFGILIDMTIKIKIKIGCADPNSIMIKSESISCFLIILLVICMITMKLAAQSMGFQVNNYSYVLMAQTWVKSGIILPIVFCNESIKDYLCEILTMIKRKFQNKNQVSPQEELNMDNYFIVGVNPCSSSYSLP